MINVNNGQQLEDLFDNNQGDDISYDDDEHGDLSLPDINNIDKEIEDEVNLSGSTDDDIDNGKIPDGPEVQEGVETESQNGQSDVSAPNECASNTFLPNYLNCTSFLFCDNGLQKIVNCPPNMWFDPNYKGETLCNYPEVVCAADQTVCNCAVEYPPLPPDPLIEYDLSCLIDNRFHMKGSSVDCGRYFICFNENIFRLECRNGFHYNPRTEMCDYPELVNCKV